MSVITISFYEGETGESAPVPADFKLRLFPPGSDQLQEVRAVPAPGQKFVALVAAGIYTVHFGTEEGIASLDPETPGDIALVVLEGEEGRAYFDIYLWELQPEGVTPLPQRVVPSGTRQVQVTCGYCDNRYLTPGTPYYLNDTWYNNCYTNPPCT